MNDTEPKLMSLWPNLPKHYPIKPEHNPVVCVVGLAILRNCAQGNQVLLASVGLGVQLLRRTRSFTRSMRHHLRLDWDYVCCVGKGMLTHYSGNSLHNFQTTRWQSQCLLSNPETRGQTWAQTLTKHIIWRLTVGLTCKVCTSFLFDYEVFF